MRTNGAPQGCDARGDKPAERSAAPPRAGIFPAPSHHPPSPPEKTQRAPSSADDPNQVAGRIVVHRDGYGFVVPERAFPGIDGDLYVGRDNPSNNKDRAGTPENFKTAVIPGARGNGGTNYTGTYSGSAKID